MYDLYVFLNSQDLSHLKEGVPCDVLSYCDHEDMVCQETVQEKRSNIIILSSRTHFSLRKNPQQPVPNPSTPCPIVTAEGSYCRWCFMEVFLLTPRERDLHSLSNQSSYPFLHK